MGKEIEKILHTIPGVSVQAIVDDAGDWDLYFENFLQSDVAIEFSVPSDAYDNCKKCLEHHIPVVTGTTGWHDGQKRLLDEYGERGGSIVYGSNFSIGANLFFLLNKQLAHWMDSQNAYEVRIEETHHLAKKDEPSGTAISLAQLIIGEIERKSSWTKEEIGADKVAIRSFREGEVTGIHKVRYDSEEDTISLMHTAHNRKGFASGAVKAALWLADHPGIYNFQDIFLLFNKK